MDVEARTVVVDGLGYLEGSRWHDGALWFSDLKHQKVHRLDGDGTLTTVLETPGVPSGLGFTSDGNVLIVSIDGDCLWRWAPGDDEPTVVGDFSAFGPHPNDMAVDGAGRSYITHFGYDLFVNETPRKTGVIVRHPDGRVELTGSLDFPNGIVISEDGKTLFVSESFGAPQTRLSAFDIGDDGTLANQRVIREFGPTKTHVVDGICVDVENGVWVSVCYQGQYHRVLPDGTITDTITIPPDGGNYVVDSALGGQDMRTLFMLIADADQDRINDDFATTARIETVEVDVPGVALD